VLRLDTGLSGRQQSICCFEGFRNACHDDQPARATGHRRPSQASLSGGPTRRTPRRRRLLRAERGGVRLQARDSGPARAEAVVLLHGFPQDSTCWDAVIPFLHTAGLRTITVDQRGYGRSGSPPGGHAVPHRGTGRRRPRRCRHRRNRASPPRRPRLGRRRRLARGGPAPRPGFYPHRTVHATSGGIRLVPDPLAAAAT
jgi:hypothetical protein